MNTASKQTLADSLKSYSIYVKYWEPEAGDSHLFLGHREFLQEHLAELTDAQRQQLTEADQVVMAFAAQRYENEDDDVRILRMCVEVITGGVDKKAA